MILKALFFRPGFVLIRQRKHGGEPAVLFERISQWMESNRGISVIAEDNRCGLPVQGGVLNGNSQFDRVVGRVNQILLGAKIAFGSLY